MRAQPDLQDQPGEDIELACLPASPVGAQEAHATPQLFGGAQMAPTAADAQQAASPPAYVHCHSFDVARCAVSVLKFAPGSADRLAWGADDGAVYLATAEQPPRLLQVLERHRGKVSDLAWSPDGATLLTCSQDGTACLWEAGCGRLVRGVHNLSGPLGCCAFHPVNPNLLLLGTAAGELLTLNASTGHLVAKAELQAAPMARVGACSLAPSDRGQLLAADSRGCLHLFDASLHGGAAPRMALLAHLPPSRNRFHEPACLEYAAHSGLAGGAAVLLVLSSGEVVLSRLHQKPYRLEAVQEVRTAPASAKVRASLRPGYAARQQAVLATGGEDCRVHLVGLSQAGEAPRLLAALTHHHAPVLGVAWSWCGSRLASSDMKGVVVVWREETAQPASDDPAADGLAAP